MNACLKRFKHRTYRMEESLVAAKTYPRLFGLFEQVRNTISLNTTGFVVEKPRFHVR